MIVVGLICLLVFFFFKQKTAYEMRISDWSSDVCSSDLRTILINRRLTVRAALEAAVNPVILIGDALYLRFEELVGLQGVGLDVAARVVLQRLEYREFVAAVAGQYFRYEIGRAHV